MSNNTIAHRYAGAFFSYINQNHASSAAKIWEEFSALASLCSTSSDFANVIKNPTISNDEKLAIFSALKKSGRISDELYKFIAVLIEKKRLTLFADIEKSVQQFIMEAENKVEAEAVFAEAANDAVKKELVKRLEHLTGKTIVLKDKIDPSVIGGVKVKLGSRLYDATIKGQLDKLKASLI